MKRVLPVLLIALVFTLSSCVSDKKGDKLNEKDTLSKVDTSDGSSDFSILEKRMEEITSKDSLNKE